MMNRKMVDSALLRASSSMFLPLDLMETTALGWRTLLRLLVMYDFRAIIR